MRCSSAPARTSPRHWRCTTTVPCRFRSTPSRDLEPRPRPDRVADHAERPGPSSPSTCTATRWTWTALIDIADRHGLLVIEDCAESHGATVRGRKTGSFGDMGCFSFYANKIITTGEGGMVTTNDDGLAERLRLLRNLAFTKPRFRHEEAGYNFRMTGYQAAMGWRSSQDRDIIAAKRRVAATYNRLLADIPGLQLPVEGLGAATSTGCTPWSWTGLRHAAATNWRRDSQRRDRHPHLLLSHEPAAGPAATARVPADPLSGGGVPWERDSTCPPARTWTRRQSLRSPPRSAAPPGQPGQSTSHDPLPRSVRRPVRPVLREQVVRGGGSVHR